MTTGRLYIVSSSQKGLQELLHLWKLWREKKKFPEGQAPWKTAFSHLLDIRSWGIEDRLRETNAEEDLEEAIKYDHKNWPTELELWYLTLGPDRQRASQRVRALVQELGGQVLSECSLEDIRYHGLRVDLPVANLQQVGKLTDIELVKSRHLQFIRPQSKFIPPNRLPTEKVAADYPDITVDYSSKPRLAVLDGLPIANHPDIIGRVQVDDPDNWGNTYEANKRRHGTAMASLILNGDLSAPSPFPGSIYHRPILKLEPCDSGENREESFPSDQLIVDVVHRAVRRLFEASEGKVAPTVKVINLSVGDSYRPYISTLSPLARLLDWLSWKYKVLFIISAGNHGDCFKIDLTNEQYETADADAIGAAVCRAMIREQRNRRLLSPAEACNALTVGATWSDGSAYPPPLRYPALTDFLPAFYSSLGPGHRKQVKPDILLPGGRITVPNPLGMPNEPAQLKPLDSDNAPGHLVAAPGGGSSRAYSAGTSNAAALASHQALKILSSLTSLRNTYPNDWPEEVPEALWAKLLLIHASSWGIPPARIDSTFKDTFKNQKRARISRFLGFGIHNPDRCLSCTAQRATLLGGGLIKVEEGQEFRCPLPAALSTTKEWRRLTYSLVYFTPIVPNRQEYFAVDLWLEPLKKPGAQLKVKALEVDHNAIKRGTVLHNVLEGTRAANYVDGEYLGLKVNCRKLADDPPDLIPYALAVTLEVKAGVKLPIYEQIRDQLQVMPKIPVR